ncbi:MAG: hypothetical protein KBT04_07385, partial [Bacteroidales bacterium]|nr:hypothetical protein [Candidatus Colimorpha onthohippi]
MFTLVEPRPFEDAQLERKKTVHIAAIKKYIYLTFFINFDYFMFDHSFFIESSTKALTNQIITCLLFFFLFFLYEAEEGRDFFLVEDHPYVE